MQFWKQSIWVFGLKPLQNFSRSKIRRRLNKYCCTRNFDIEFANHLNTAICMQIQAYFVLILLECIYKKEKVTSSSINLKSFNIGVMQFIFRESGRIILQRPKKTIRYPVNIFYKFRYFCILTEIPDFCIIFAANWGVWPSGLPSHTS